MENLYMFAIMPPTELSARIDNERKEFAENYKCIAALKPPVHITMHEPFKSDAAIEEKIMPLSNWTEKQRPVHIELKNFSYFDNAQKPVLYIDVVKNDDLKALHKGFTAQLRKYIPIEPNRTPFVPHFTIGYRDVKPAIFPGIREAYSKKRFQGSFLADKLYFWKHDGSRWRVHKSFTLAGNAAYYNHIVQQQLF